MAALIQTTLVPSVRIFDISPNLVLLFTVSWVLIRGIQEGILMGLLAGVVLDISSGAAFGLITLSLTAATGFAGIGEINVFRGAWFLKYLVIAGATLLFGGLFLLLLSITGRGFPLFPTLGRIILPEMLVNTAFMPFVYGATYWLDRRIEPQPVGF